jgi:hypothetical protein
MKSRDGKSQRKEKRRKEKIREEKESEERKYKYILYISNNLWVRRVEKWVR